MRNAVEMSGLRLKQALHALLRDEIAPGTGIEPAGFWSALSKIVYDLSATNRALLDKRKALQQQIDSWCLSHRGRPFDVDAYRTFIEKIGYLTPEGENFQVSTENVDLEIAGISGPQLVVPLDNARYALNAANARWGSLYDALYGTDLISADARKFAGYTLKDGALSSLLLKNHELHIEIQIDHNHPIGKQHPAGVKDVLLEAAVTTIQDCEDSVAAVDASDKVRIYRNWSGIMHGTLEAALEKDGRAITRRLNSDRTFTTPSGQILILPGRSLLLVRHVGIHMYTDAVTTADGEQIPEGFLDAMVTALAALHDLKHTGDSINSRKGSVYVVKPKMHGAEQVAATVELFSRVEDALGMKRNTLKIGIMDEERRLTVNLKESIRAARERLVFINTGFLDRTGDEIHTNMELGAMLPKMEIKNQPWLSAYEDWNVDIRIETGLIGKRRLAKACGPCPTRCARWLKLKPRIPTPAPTPPGCRRQQRRRFMRCTTTKSMSGNARPKSRATAGQAWQRS